MDSVLQLVAEHAKALAAICAAVAGAAGFASRLHRKHLESVRVREKEAKAVRYLLDAVRHMLHEDLDELPQQRVLIDFVRQEIWAADGHSVAEQTNEEILKVLTRTQRIDAKRAAEIRTKIGGRQ